MNFIRKLLGLEPKLHYFSFAYTHLEGSAMTIANTYTGYPDKLITKLRIDANKINADVSQDAVLTSVSYLGYCTRSEMAGEMKCL